MIEELINSISLRIWVFLELFRDFADWVSTFFWYIISIVKTLWYGLVSMTSWIVWLVDDVIWNGAILSLYDTLNNLANLIWGPTFVFIASMFLIIISRIIIAFIFKLFRLNIDYHALNSKSKTWNQHDSLQKYNWDSLFK